MSNLRQLFDQTKGDIKSKCIKSALFDQSRWQIFLYPVRSVLLFLEPDLVGPHADPLAVRCVQNSGNDQYLSIYLSCEPTVAEKERALAEQPALSANDGGHAHQGGKEKERVPWRRDGKFLFTFEVRPALSRSLSAGALLIQSVLLAGPLGRPARHVQAARVGEAAHVLVPGAQLGLCQLPDAQCGASSSPALRTSRRLLTIPPLAGVLQQPQHARSSASLFSSPFLSVSSC